MKRGSGLVIFDVLGAAVGLASGSAYVVVLSRLASNAPDWFFPFAFPLGLLLGIAAIASAPFIIRRVKNRPQLQTFLAAAAIASFVPLCLLGLFFWLLQGCC